MRRLFKEEILILKVSDGFPRLTLGNVAVPIRRTNYEIDLDLVSADDVGIEYALRHLGVV